MTFRRWSTWLGVMALLVAAEATLVLHIAAVVTDKSVCVA